MTHNAYVLKNTLTNYLLVVLRVVQGILVTRWLFNSLGNEYYGFWSLMWTLLVYALLLDFGFSKAAQKYTATGLFNSDPDSYNRYLSAVFSLLSLMATIIASGCFIASYFLTALTRIDSPEQLAYCRLTLRVFGIGCALVFPTGIFPEILVGLRKIYLRNYVLAGTRITETLGIAVILSMGGSLLALAFFTVSLNLSTNFVMYALCRREIPSLRLRLRWDPTTLRELADFSGFIYLISICSLIIRKTDHLVLSIFAGLKAVGIYQLGGRLPDLCDNLATQYQENIAPLSAALHASNQRQNLRDLIFCAMRFSSFMAAGGISLAYIVCQDLIALLFNVHDPDVIQACRWLLINAAFTIAVRSVTDKFLMMSGRHRLLASLYIVEAVAHLLLSVLLTRRYGVVGVIFGTLIPNAALAIFILLPYIIRFVKHSPMTFLDKVYLRPAFAAALMAFTVLVARQYLTGSMPQLLQLVVVIALGGVVYCGVFLGVNPDDWQAVQEFFRQKLKIQNHPDTRTGR